MFGNQNLLTISSLFFGKYRLIETSIQRRDHYIIFVSNGPTLMAPVSIELANLFKENSNKILTFEQLTIRETTTDNDPMICIIKPEDIALADISTIEKIFQNSSSVFYSIVFTALRDYDIPLINLKDLSIKILKTLSQTTDVKKLTHQLEMLQICVLFPKIISNDSDSDSEIKLLVQEESKKLVPLMDHDDTEFSDTLFRFIFNNCEEKRDVLFLKFFSHKKENIRARAIGFIDKKIKTQSVIEKIHESFNSDPSKFITYTYACKIVETGIFLDSEIQKIVNTIIDWSSNSANKKFRISALLTIIDLSNQISQRNNSSKDFEFINEHIYNLLQEFAHEEPIDYPFFRYQQLKLNDVLAKKIRTLCLDNNPNVQKISIIIWSKIRKHEDLFTEFVKISKESQHDVKTTAISCLKNFDLNDENILSALIDLLFDSDERLSEKAAFLLTKIKSQKQRQRIIKNIQDKGSGCVEKPACFSILWEYLVLPHLDKFSA